MRLSFMRFSCLFVLSAIFAASVAEAMTYEYDMATSEGSTASGATPPIGWVYNSIGKSDGSAYFNHIDDWMSSQIALTLAITNVTVEYKGSSATPAKMLQLIPLNGDGDGAGKPFDKVTKRSTKVFEFDADAGISDVKMKLVSISEGTAGNWTVYSVKIYTLDPPPTLGAIASQEIGSENSLSLKLDIDTVEDDELTFDCAGLLLPEMSNLAADSYGVEKIGDDYYLCFSPQTAGITAGTVSFTLSVTGKGGRSNIVSFDCAVTQGVVKTPPSVDEIDAQSVLARRTLTVPFTVREADGDVVTTNYVCKTAGVAGLSGFDADGAFFYTPSLEDVELSPVSFEIQATDPEGTGTAEFSVSVTAGTPPAIGDITGKSVNFGGQLKVTLPITATDGDEITLTNVVCEAAAGTVTTVTNMVFYFDPAEADIGETLTFSVTAEDFDGTAAKSFDVAVKLAAPVALNCGADEWNRTSFLAAIEADVPGAESYLLRVICDPDSETPVTNDIANATFPYEVKDLTADKCRYFVQALRGTVKSDWSNAIDVNLADYRDAVAAIPMTDSAHGVYENDFNSLPAQNGVWYDGLTMPGWYAATDSTSLSGEEIKPYDGKGSETGILLTKGHGEAGDYGLGLRADTQYDNFSFGLVFTNECRYAVTNLTVSFSAYQYHRYKSVSTLKFSYAHGIEEFVPITAANVDIEELSFTAPNIGTSDQLKPPVGADLSASIAFEGENAILPGDTIALRWFLEAKASMPGLGIDNLRVQWDCKSPVATVIMLQ